MKRPFPMPVPFLYYAKTYTTFCGRLEFEDNAHTGWAALGISTWGVGMDAMDGAGAMADIGIVNTTLVKKYDLVN